MTIRETKNIISVSTFLTLASMLVSLALVASQTGCSSESQATASTTEPAAAVPSVEVGRVEPGDVERTLVALAELSPKSRITVLPTLAERVSEVNFEEGQEVAQGEVLVRMRRGSLKSSRAQLDAQIESLDAQLAQQERELTRAKKLRDGQVMTSQSVEQLESTLAATKASKNALKASRNQLSLSLDDSVVKAPMKGVIVNKSVQLGDLISPQVPLAQLLDLDTLEATLQLGERDAVLVAVGQTVSVSVDALPGQHFEAKVTRIAPYASAANRTVSVVAELPNPKSVEGVRALKPGLFARAELVVERREHVLTAPSRGLLLDDALLSEQHAGERLRKAFVVVADGTVEQRRVRVGESQGERSEVLEGLALGEALVVRGSRGLADGDAVNAVNLADSDARQLAVVQ